MSKRCVQTGACLCDLRSRAAVVLTHVAVLQVQGASAVSRDIPMLWPEAALCRQCVPTTGMLTHGASALDRFSEWAGRGPGLGDGVPCLLSLPPTELYPHCALPAELAGYLLPQLHLADVPASRSQATPHTTALAPD